MEIHLLFRRRGFSSYRLPIHPLYPSVATGRFILYGSGCFSLEGNPFPPGPSDPLSDRLYRHEHLLDLRHLDSIDLSRSWNPEPHGGVPLWEHLCPGRNSRHDRLWLHHRLRLETVGPGAKDHPGLFPPLGHGFSGCGRLLLPAGDGYFLFLRAHRASGILHPGTLASALCAESTPRRALGTVFGLSNSIAFLGAILAPIITGLIKDWTQSFQWGFYLGAMAMGVAAILAWKTLPRALK